ncbi:MAG: alpha-amylase, partial [Treponema sp.]|nr:alpha-amylase [Treponema sp.]
DLDGEGEYLFQGEKINCYVRLKGAGVFELDFLPKPWNYLGALSFPGEEKSRGGSFTEYLFPADFSIADLGEGRVSGVRYCGSERFQAVEMDKTRLRAGFVLAAGECGPFAKLEVRKTYSVKKDTLSASWSLTNRGTERQDFVFAPSIALSFPGEGDAFVRVYRAGEKDPVAGDGIIGGTEGLKFQDVKNGVTISLGSRRSFDAWMLPPRTPESYQSTWILPRQKVSLEGGTVWDTEFTMKFS